MPEDVIRSLILKRSADITTKVLVTGKNNRNNGIHLKKMTLSEMYELLMDYTHQYTRMMNGGVRGKEFKECEEMILRLQEEINERRNISERNPK